MNTFAAIIILLTIGWTLGMTALLYFLKGAKDEEV